MIFITSGDSSTNPTSDSETGPSGPSGPVAAPDTAGSTDATSGPLCDDDCAGGLLSVSNKFGGGNVGFTCDGSTTGATAEVGATDATGAASAPLDEDRTGGLFSVSSKFGGASNGGTTCDGPTLEILSPVFGILVHSHLAVILLLGPTFTSVTRFFVIGSILAAEGAGSGAACAAAAAAATAGSTFAPRPKRNAFLNFSNFSPPPENPFFLLLLFFLVTRLFLLRLLTFLV